MFKLLGRMSLASALVLLGTTAVCAQGSFILGADDWADWGGVTSALGPWSGVTVNESEPNDGSGTADAVAVGDDYAGSIDLSGLDTDYAAFVVTAGDSIQAATVDVSGLGDTQLTLYDTDGVTQLAFDDDSGPVLLSKLTYTFTATGTYYLKVGSYATNVGAYSMELRVAGATVAIDAWVYIRKALEAVAPGVTRAGHDGSVAVLGAAGALATPGDAGAAYHHCVPLAAANTNLSGVVSFHDGVSALQTFFTDLGTGAENPQIIVLAGSGSDNDMDSAEAAELALNGIAVANYINSGGGLIAHGDDYFATSMVYDWLPAFIPAASVAQRANSPRLTNEGKFNLPAMADADHYVNADGHFQNHGLDVFMTAPGDSTTLPGTGVTVNESEVNDDFFNANAVLVGDDASGSIDNLGADEDYYSLSVTAGDLISFETIDVAGLGDTQLSLFGSDGVTLLEFDDDDGPGLLSLINYSFTASGTYYIMVGSFGANTGGYTLETRLSTVGPDEDVIVGRLPSAWDWLGNDLAGVSGKPLLIPTGTLGPSSPFTLSLIDAAPSASAFLILGFSILNAPTKGGILVPTPQFIFGLGTNPSGELSFGASLGSPPSGATFFLQYWIIDAAGPVGFSASNGISGTTP